MNEPIFSGIGWLILALVFLTVGLGLGNMVRKSDFRSESEPLWTAVAVAFILGVVFAGIGWAFLGWGLYGGAK